MLGCIQPMSSPMMKRMFGFCVPPACACAILPPPMIGTLTNARQPINIPPARYREFVRRFIDLQLLGILDGTFCSLVYLAAPR